MIKETSKEMSKLLDMFRQAQRAQAGGGMGFLGKTKSEIKPRAAAIIVALSTLDKSSAEAAIRAGADSVIFSWDGEDATLFEALHEAVEAAKAAGGKRHLWAANHRWLGAVRS